MKQVYVHKCINGEEEDLFFDSFLPMNLLEMVRTLIVIEVKSAHVQAGTCQSELVPARQACEPDRLDGHHSALWT